MVMTDSEAANEDSAHKPTMSPCALVHICFVCLLTTGELSCGVVCQGKPGSSDGPVHPLPSA